jgi:hypothetical protein
MTDKRASVRRTTWPCHRLGRSDAANWLAADSERVAAKGRAIFRANGVTHDLAKKLRPRRSLAHRVLAADVDRPVSEIEGEKSDAGGQYENMLVENLRKAGVQNTFKNERLKFDRLESFAGEWLQASGGYTDAVGKVRRAAVSIGPQYGTVTADHIKQAVKEAVRGMGFDLLIVCGFAFDASVSEEIRRYGNLTVGVWGAGRRGGSYRGGRRGGHFERLGCLRSDYGRGAAELDK